MKFVSTIIAAFLGFASAKSLSNKDISRRLKNGQFNKRTLMSKAKPYGRKLDQEAEEFEITGEYSIQFDYCLSLKLQNENLFAEDYVEYAEAGKIVSEKSYITFNVCKTEYCYYDAEDDKNTYIVDVNTFVMALADYIPQQRQNYCQGCEENEDYCYGNLGEEEDEADAEEEDGEDEEGEGDDEGDEGEDGDEDEEGEGEDEDGEEGEDEEGEDEDNRRLAKTTKRRKLAEQKEYVMIDCDLCQEYGCYQNDEGDDENADGDEEEEEALDYDDVVEWIEAIAQCNQLDQVWLDGNTNLYSGFICNEDGTGVEIGLFLDEDCTMYTTTEKYANVADEDDQAILSMSAEVIQNMFTTDLNCDDTEIVYYNPYEGYEAEEEDDNGEDDEEEAAEANEWCQNVFQGDEFEALSLADCEAENNGDDAQAGDDDYVANYEWYSFELTQDDLEDGAAVCAIVRELDGEYSTVYSGDNSGHVFDYTANTSQSKAGGGLSGAAIAAIVIVALIVVGVGAAWAMGGSKKKDTKRKPLISGSMA